MNEEMEQFEQRLRRQPARPIPADWRADILAAAREAQAPSAAPQTVPWSLLLTIKQQLSTLLWPHPKAWGALATVWVMIFVLHFAARDAAPARAEHVSVASPEIVAELRQQQKLYAELLGVTEARDADRPKDIPARPRTERAEILSA